MKILPLLLLLLPVFVNAAQITRGVYVEDPAQTTTILRLRTSEPSPVWLEYGPAPECRQIMALSPEGTEHKFVLYGLVPNKEFCYNAYTFNAEKDGLQEPQTGRWRTLYTPERKEVKFVVFGNTAGTNEEGRQKLAVRLAAETKPDFFVHTGNLVSTGLDIDADAEYFTPFKPVFSVAPFFIAAGEKEYGILEDPKDKRAIFNANYRRTHDMTWSRATPNYYSFDTANARFIFLNSGSLVGNGAAPTLEKESDQYKWLRTTLAGAGSDKWKIVVLHNPLKTTGASVLRAKTPEILKIEADLTNLLEYYGVNLVIQGSDYNYERTFPIRRSKEDGEDYENEKGVVYATFGTGASDTLSKREGGKAWTARFVSAQVYGVLEIVDRRLNIKVYNLEGKLLDNADLEFN